MRWKPRSWLVIAGVWAAEARADDHPPPAPAASSTSASADPGQLTDEELLELAEAIEIFDERPDKPYDRDTAVRLTGEELAARGAVDLGTALALLPDVTVRAAGRGGQQISIRGARKGEVTILIDGVAVSDPYYGTFDVSSIPITDIVQIRVATTPQSPIDGPGGPGGVIEVHTRDAIGPQLVVGRLTTDSHPSFGMTGTARVALAKHLALRISTSNSVGARDLALPGDATVGEGRRAATGSARLEYRKGDRRIAVDAFLDDRSYLSPPSDSDAAIPELLMVDEMSFRASAKFDEKIDKLQLQAQAWTHSLERRSSSFRDPALTDLYRQELISAMRFGGKALATQPFRKDFRWIASASLGREHADVRQTASAPPDDRSRGDVTLGELAVGLQYERKRLRIEGAAGVAVPFGIDADPWPESKLVVRYKPVQQLELTATGGYKGRIPSLRERFDATMGDPTLDPERVAHAELRAVEKLGERAHFEVATFYRKVDGFIGKRAGKFINGEFIDVYGLDVIARVHVHRRLEVGTGYQLVEAESKISNDPLDFLPRHKLDVWARAELARGISALGRVKYMSTAFDLGMEVGNYALFEGNLTASLGTRYLAVLRVDDALDERPELRAGFPSAGRVISLILQGSWD